MSIGFDWSQQSTKRGAIWVIGSVTSLVFYWFGKDPLPVIAVTGSLAGGLGLVTKD